MAYTNQRNAEDIKRELSLIIPELKDPRISGMLSVVQVDLSGDGSLCKVYVSAMEGIATAKVSARGLKAAGGYIRHEIGSRLRLRVIPQFDFIADDRIEYSAQLAQKIKDLDVKKDDAEEKPE